MLPVQAQTQQQPVQQKTPWYKKPWAAPVLGAGALGAGYLADKLINKGNITSSLLSSAKPTGIPEPSYVPSVSNTSSQYTPRVAEMFSKGNAYTQTDAAEGNYLFGKKVDTPVMAAGGLAGLSLLGNKGLQMLGGLFGKSWGSTKLPSIAGPIANVAAPLADYNIGSDKFYADGAQYAMKNYFGKDISPEAAQKITGAMGAGVGLLGYRNPAANAALTVAMDIMRRAGNAWQSRIDNADAMNHNASLIHKTLLDAYRDNDMASIQQIKNLFPDLAEQSYFENLPSSKKWIQDVYQRLGGIQP